jgi:hypothetical protein
MKGILNMNMKNILLIQILTLLIFIQWNCSDSSINSTSDKSNDNHQNDKARIIGEISDLFQVPRLLVDEKQVYVWDKFLCKVCIYSKSDLKKVAEFGTKGEGPGELRVIHGAYLYKDYIYINSFPKIGIFSKKGQFIKEIRGSTMAGNCQPIRKNYIGKKYVYTPPGSKINKIVYVLLNADLHKIKDLMEVSFMSNTIQVNPQKVNVLIYRDCTKGIVYKDKYYVGSTNRGFFFAVFDEEGNKLYELNQDYQRRKITGEFKNRMISILKRNVEDWEKFSENRGYYFPEFFPAFISFAIDSDKLYVFTYPLPEEPKFLEVLIFDLQGKLIKKKSIPSLYAEDLMLESYYFYDGNIYIIEHVHKKSDNLHVLEVRVE